MQQRKDDEQIFLLLDSVIFISKQGKLYEKHAVQPDVWGSTQQSIWEMVNPQNP
jgi:hypothetical protein